MPRADRAAARARSTRAAPCRAWVWLGFGHRTRLTGQNSYFVQLHRVEHAAGHAREQR
jgi:hypothetical protein